MPTANVDRPARLVLDAGPLIALLHGKDADHEAAVAGFRRLAGARSRLIAPLPIVFEVYKWLAYEVSTDAARVGLARMRQSLELPLLDRPVVHELAGLLEAMPRWTGSLEDALVAMVALRTDTPVWTVNYRDLAAFPNFRFWTPA